MPLKSASAFASKSLEYKHSSYSRKWHEPLMKARSLEIAEQKSFHSDFGIKIFKSHWLGTHLIRCSCSVWQVPRQARAIQAETPDKTSYGPPPFRKPFVAAQAEERRTRVLNNVISHTTRIIFLRATTTWYQFHANATWNKIRTAHSERNIEVWLPTMLLLSLIHNQ